MSSYAFSPSVGGIEAASEMLANEFVNAGHDVRVITQSYGDESCNRAFGVIRRPSIRQLWSLHRWAEVILHNNLSVRFLWPNFIIRRPCLVTTQTWLSGSLGLETLLSRLKRLILCRCGNVAVSGAIAEHVGLPGVILGNPYDDHTFRLLPGVERNRELLFVGRIVGDKGLDLLLRALPRLREANLQPRLTVVGDGPDRGQAEALVRQLGLTTQVTFTGVVRGAELAKLMNGHRILVMPSRWAEPFGIVALEGIACGCVVVGSKAGGLQEAIGPCGLTVPNENEEALASALRRVLVDATIVEKARENAAAHLEKFQAAVVGRAYLELFQQKLR